MLTQEELKNAYRYEPLTGRFFSLRWRRYVSGNVTNYGTQLRIKGKLYMSHRLAWLYMTGEFPASQIDHIDRNSTNNKWDNLREATNMQNAHNQNKRRNTSSRFKGVSWCSVRGRYRATIRVNKKLIDLGSFKQEEEAANAYRGAAEKYFGEYSNSQARLLD